MSNDYTTISDDIINSEINQSKKFKYQHIIKDMKVKPNMRNGLIVKSPNSEGLISGSNVGKKPVKISTDFGQKSTEIGEQVQIKSSEFNNSFQLKSVH